VYIMDFRPTPCTSKRTITPTCPYIAQLAILSYKVGYKNKDEEDTTLPFTHGEIWE